MLLLNPGGWSLRLRLRAVPGPGVVVWVGWLGWECWGLGRGLYRPAGASLHLLWADTQQQPCLPQRVSRPRGWPGCPWPRGDRAWRVMTPVIPQVSVCQRTHEAPALEELNLLCSQAGAQSWTSVTSKPKPVHSSFCLSWIRSEPLRAGPGVWATSVGRPRGGKPGQQEWEERDRDPVWAWPGASATASAESSHGRAEWPAGPPPIRLMRLSRSGQTEWHPRGLPCLTGPWALGLPPLLFRRAPWTPCPPCPAGLCPPSSCRENYTLSSDAVSLHRRNRLSLAPDKHTFLLHQEALLVSSVTCTCCGQKAVPGSVLGGGGMGAAWQEGCQVPGVSVGPRGSGPNLAASGRGGAATGWPWGPPARSPSGGTFLGPWPGQLGRAGADERYFGSRGEETKEALFAALLSAHSLSWEVCGHGRPPALTLPTELYFQPRPA